MCLRPPGFKDNRTNSANEYERQYKQAHNAKEESIAQFRAGICHTLLAHRAALCISIRGKRK